jgi:enoyl-[acyl-carrier-protein] reductase (NADH)
VRVNTVMPGPTRTEGLIRLVGEGAVQEMGDLNMLKRMADPAEIAEVVLFLAEQRASFITGAVIAADGWCDCRLTALGGIHHAESQSRWPNSFMSAMTDQDKEES